LAEIIEMADEDVLDIARSRAVQQEVLDSIYERASPAFLGATG
jgi:hypothetical protein